MFAPKLLFDAKPSRPIKAGSQKSPPAIWQKVSQKRSAPNFPKLSHGHNSLTLACNNDNRISWAGQN
jgi:hypothetical protein